MLQLKPLSIQGRPPLLITSAKVHTYHHGVGTSLETMDCAIILMSDVVFADSWNA